MSNPPYSNLSFANMSIYSMRNQVCPEIMTFFDTNEQRFYSSIAAENYQETVCQYATSADKVIKRLEIMGFTLKKAKKEFESGIQALLDYEEENGCEDNIQLNSTEKEFFGNFTFDIWLDSMRMILKNRGAINLDSKSYPYVGFMLGEYHFSFDPDYFSEDLFINRYLFGFSHYDVPDYDNSKFPTTEARFVFRAILEVCNKNDEVILDYSDLYSDDKNLLVEVPKIILLVEGSSDRRILEKTLLAIYPDLHKYYSFMDFHASNSAGGASFLVTDLKAFIGAGIQNKIIAIFDNDTAATDALRAISNVKLPQNIRIVRLPYLKLATNYPTIGAQGNVNMDVNGLACSLELYLGEDILCDNGTMTPIQWQGYNQILKQYQGEILNKKELQEKYIRIIDNILEHPHKANLRNWDSMKLVFESIFNAFN